MEFIIAIVGVIWIMSKIGSEDAQRYAVKKEYEREAEDEKKRKSRYCDENLSHNISLMLERDFEYQTKAKEKFQKEIGSKNIPALRYSYHISYYEYKGVNVSAKEMERTIFNSRKYTKYMLLANEGYVDESWYRNGIELFRYSNRVENYVDEVKFVRYVRDRLREHGKDLPLYLTFRNRLVIKDSDAYNEVNRVARYNVFLDKDLFNLDLDDEEYIKMIR